MNIPTTVGLTCLNNMKCISLDTTTRLNEGYAATIGFFDGVHLGHQHLLRRVVQVAEAKGLSSMVITFDRDPRQVVAPEREPKHLCTMPMKLRWMEQMGLDVCVLLSFDQAMAQLSAANFMQTILSRQLNVRALVLGHDNRFGRPQGETFENYDEMGKNQGIDVVLCDAYEPSSGRCSSTEIRRLVTEGYMDDAEELLGRPYTIEGLVVDGEKEGRRLGFPTANISLESASVLLPPEGVYAVSVVLPEESQPRHGMMNIGRRPTFGVHNVTLEVHIFNFAGNLYGRRLQVMMHRRIRTERPFSTEQQLATQLQADRQTIEQYFKQKKQSET